MFFLGISKTSTLFTTTGLSLLGAVQGLAEDYDVNGPCCLPIARVANVLHNAFIYVVKLHESARYVFRFEIYGEQARRMSEEDLCGVTSALASNSKDISFPGYPYGLIDADSFARVSGDGRRMRTGFRCCRRYPSGAGGRRFRGMFVPATRTACWTC